MIKSQIIYTEQKPANQIKLFLLLCDLLGENQFPLLYKLIFLETLLLDRTIIFLYQDLFNSPSTALYFNGSI